MNSFIRLLKERSMTLIMSLPKNDPELCRAAFDAGADVVKVHCNVQHHASGTGFGRLDVYKDTFSQMLSAAPGPMGLVPGADARDVLRDMESASALPFAFFSLYLHHAPVEVLSMPQALMAACAPGDEEREAAHLAPLGAQALEASIMPHEGYAAPLTVKDLTQYSALCQATPLPVVVPTQRAIRPEDVKYLKDAGVRGLMIGAIVTGREQKTIVDAIRAFRRAIDTL